MPTTTRRIPQTQLLCAIILLVAIGAYFAYTRLLKTSDRVTSQTEVHSAAPNIIVESTQGTPEQTTHLKSQPIPILVSGHVYDSKHQPIPDALVRFTVRKTPQSLARILELPPATRSVSAAVKHEGHTDEMGAYTVEVESADLEYIAVASKAGYIATARQETIPEDGIRDFDFLLTQSGYVSGRVVDSKRRAISQAVVVATRWKGETSLGGCTESRPTDEEGRFELNQVTPNVDHRISVRYLPLGAGAARGHSMEIQLEPQFDINLAAGERRDYLELILPWDQDRQVSGRVHNSSGQPIEGAVVKAEHATSANPMAASCKSDEDGQFTIRYISLEVDAVTITANHSRYEPAVIKQIPVGTNSLDITMVPLSRGALNGKILDKRTRNPIKGARIILRAVDLPSGEHWLGHGYVTPNENSGSLSATSDSLGQFTFTGVRAGNASLLVMADTYGQSLHLVTVRPNIETREEVLLEAAGILDVSINKGKARRDQPLENLCLFYRPSGNSLQRFDMSDEDFVTDRSEYYDEIRSKSRQDRPHMTIQLSPGHYDIVVLIESEIRGSGEDINTRSYQWGTAEVFSGSETHLQFDLGGSGTIEGEVPLRGDDSHYMVVLVPTTDAALANDIDFFSNDVWGLGSNFATTTTYGATYRGQFAGERFVMPFLPEGSYTAFIACSRRDGSSYLRSVEAVTIQSDATTSLISPP